MRIGNLSEHGNMQHFSIQINLFIGRSKGGASGTPDPLGPVSFIFMQFSAKTLRNNRFALQNQGLAPSPSGKSATAILFTTTFVLTSIICLNLQKIFRTKFSRKIKNAHRTQYILCKYESK